MYKYLLQKMFKYVRTKVYIILKGPIFSWNNSTQQRCIQDFEKGRQTEKNIWCIDHLISTEYAMFPHRRHFFIVFKILFNSAYCRGHIKTINEITKKLISKVKRIRRQWRKIAYSNAVLIKRLIENFDGDLPR